MAAQQLRLLTERTSTKLDERTKATGRRGIAEARRALADHAPIDEQPRRAS